MKLFLSFCVLLLAPLGNTKHICDHGCTIKIRKSTYPCTVEERHVPDCRNKNYSFKSITHFNSEGKKFFNVTIRLNRNQQEDTGNTDSSISSLDLDLSNESEENADCYRVSFTSIFPAQKKIEVSCIEVNVKQNETVSNRNSNVEVIVAEESQHCKLLFNPSGRILKIGKICTLRGQTCGLTITNKKHHLKITVPINECQDFYLTIPESVDNIFCKSDCQVPGKYVILSELKSFPETPSCAHIFPSLFNINYKLIQAEQDKIRFRFTTMMCSNFSVILYIPCGDCYCPDWTTYNTTELLLNGKFDYSYEFTKIPPGNYCIGVTAHHTFGIYSDSAMIVTGISVVSAPLDAKVIKTEQNQIDNSKLAWIMLSVSIALLLGILMVILYVYHHRKRNRQIYIDEFETSPLLDIERKLKDIKRFSSQKLLLLRCNEDEKTNKDVENLINFLENCCYCEVLHAQTVTAQISMTETSVVDWLSDVLSISSKTIVIVTNKAYNAYHPAKFKNKPDANSCIFADRTFAVGMQILKNNENLKRIFARFCYTKNVPLNEFIDEVIEIPQALVHLFHTIHNQTSLLCREEDLISYWMYNQSFRYLFNLSNKCCSVNNTSESPVFVIPSSNVILNHNLPNSSNTVNGNQALVDFHQNDISTRQKFTNYHQEQQLSPTDVSLEQFDSGFNESNI